MLDRAWRQLRRALRDLGNGKSVQSLNLDPSLADEDVSKVEERMLACLARRGGEVSARARAAELGWAFLGLGATGRERFLRVMAQYGLDREAVDAAVSDLQRVDADGRRTAEDALRRALEPAWLRLLTQFNGLPNGVKFLVDMRAELLRVGRESGADPALQALETDLKRLLAGWFDLGFLELRRITWEASAALLEKLIDYEAVHEIKSWADLKNRLDSDRRCYAFFHPLMPEEPLSFVEVALVSGLSGDVHALLDESQPIADAASADTAIFYSISNAQRGLSGISLGNFLIKRVVDDLSRELPNIKTFATLSPVPGFRRWLHEQIVSGKRRLVTDAEAKALTQLLVGESAADGLSAALDAADWLARPDLAEALEAPLCRLAALYLYREKRPDGRAEDPVAHFHLSNGACLERICWLGDRSAKGLRESAGVMVNYRYRPADIERNRESYTSDGAVAVASSVRSLSRRAERVDSLAPEANGGAARRPMARENHAELDLPGDSRGS